MTKYILVEWPESQKFMEYKEETYVCTNSTGALFVPETLYKKVMYELQFPKKYEDTNLGTIVCYETKAIVNGEDTYWYDLEIKRGSNVLLYKHDTKEWVISKCVACSLNMPMILENSTLFPGLNCEIIGIKNG